MYTSMIGLAATAWLASTAPNWQTDYRDAKALAARENKPLVVVMCTGAPAWNGISTEGSLSPEALKALKDSYVCLYVDTDTPKGRRLAADFDITGTALIISDKTGDLQAYRHDGVQSASQLAEVFRQYANPDRVVTTTDSNRASQSNYAPAYFNPPAIQQQCLT